MYVFSKVAFFLQLRETAFQFFQKELAPLAQKIDKDDNFPEVNVSSKVGMCRCVFNKYICAPSAQKQLYQAFSIKGTNAYYEKEEYF